MDNPTDFSGQIGDVRIEDIAHNVYHVSSDQAIRMVSDDLRALVSRLEILERIEAQHANERAALTRMLTSLATESHTVGQITKMLENQISGDKAERQQRRRYLDTMLTALVILSIFNVLFHIYNRVFRRPAGGDTTYQQ